MRLHFHKCFVNATGKSLLLLLMLYPSLVHPEQNQTAEQCKVVTLRISLKAGQSYEQRIGDLTFTVRAASSRKPGDGWYFSLEDESGHDYIAPANLPLRFNPRQILGPGYSLTAQKSLSWNREVRFLMDKSDYDKIEPLWKHALWPADSPNPQNAAKNYLNTLEQLQGGRLSLKVLDFSISSDDVIHSARFEIEFIAPNGFHFDPSLMPSIAPCPGSMTIRASP